MSVPIFKARYNGKCSKCNSPIRPGDFVSWSRKTRGVIYHAKCNGDAVPGDPGPTPGEQPQPQPSPDVPGVSEERVRAIAQEEDAGIIGGLLKAVEQRLDAATPRTVKLTINMRDGQTVERDAMQNAHAMLERLVYLISKGEHVYLYGPPGSGKSTGAVQAAKLLGWRYGYASLNPQTPESRLLGFIDAGGVYRETEFFRCYKWCGTTDCDCCTGGVFCIDELDNGHPALLNTLNGMLETDADGIGRGAFPCGIVQRHPRFVCVATGNTNGRGADKLFPERRALDAAFLERFAFIAWNYDEALEKAITLSINRDARAWLKWVRNVRAFVAQHGIRVWASPRASFKGAALLRDSGWTHREIADSVLFKGLDADTVERILGACALPADAVPATPEAVAYTTGNLAVLTEEIAE